MSKTIEERIVELEEWQDKVEERLCEMVRWIQSNHDNIEALETKSETMIDDLACQFNDLKERFQNWENWMEGDPDNDYTGVEVRLKGLETWRDNIEAREPEDDYVDERLRRLESWRDNIKAREPDDEG
jgi:hypothetical protein